MPQAQNSTPVRSSAFGELLKNWRAARHLSQMHLALAGDVSQRHVSFLESGRARPSRDMVLQLADALEIPLRERNALLQAAGYTGIYLQRDLNQSEMAPVREALEMMLHHHEPYPAIVADRDWNIMMTNPAMQRTFALLGDMEKIWQRVCGDGPRNILRLTMHSAGLRPLIQNWDEVMPSFIQRVQREAAASGSESTLTLLEEMRTDPEIEHDWQQTDWEAPLAPVLPLSLAVGTEQMNLFSMISTFGTAQDVTADEIRVESFFPADQQTTQLLQMLAKQSAN